MRTLAIPALALAALTLAALVAPTASAHLSDFSQAKTLSVGPYNVIMTPKPSPMFANSALSMTAVIAKAEDGSYVTSGITPTLVLVDPKGAERPTRMDPDGTGYYVASVAVTEPGNYTARLVVNASDGPHSNATTFYVYREVGVRFRPDDPLQPDPKVGEAYSIVIDSIDPDTRAPKDPGTDLKVTLEHWTDDHVTLLSSATLDMTRVSVGRWKLDHTFADKGMYHLRFSSSSGGFKPDDVPLLHTTVDDAPPPGGNKVPAPHAASIALALFAAIALARRR